MSGDLEIKLCTTEKGASICNLGEEMDIFPIHKKYKEAMDAYQEYQNRMGEIQKLFEAQLGTVLLLVGAGEKPTLNDLANKYGVRLIGFNPEDAT